MIKLLRFTENQDNTISAFVCNREVMRDNKEIVDKRFLSLSDMIGTTTGLGFGAGLGMLALTVNPFFVLLVFLIPIEVLTVSVFLNRGKPKK